ncbi:MAG: D-alanine--D-alanine ligase [Deltaproteobacteria bacterium]|nr:D-alanine--D-alanine ligase [Deltaproteobacteria bacterium]
MADEQVEVGARLTVLVVFGGRSAEHEISLVSARFVIDSLDPARYRAILCGIDKAGRWRHLEPSQLPSSKDPRQVGVDAAAPLAWLLPMPPAEGERHLLHVEGREPEPIDVVFPVLHGPYGEDGCLQGLLELASLPYVGSGVAASAVGMDKLHQKRVFAHAELPLVPWVSLTRAELERDRAAVLERAATLGFPCFVKPANMGSSVGVSKVRSPEGLEAAIVQALAYDTTVVIEQGLEAPREVELAVLGNDEPIVSGAGEIAVRHADGFYSYEAKYLDPEGAVLLVPAELRPAELASLQILALQAYRVLGCSGLARIDLFVCASDVYVNEVNTLPGFTAVSMFPRLWQASGIDGKTLVTRLIELAFARHAERARLATTS